VPSAPSLPLQLVLNHRVVDSLTVEFIQWQGKEFAEASEAVLMESGRWSGTDAAYDELHTSLSSGDSWDFLDLPAIQVPALSEP
jgi:hypothetical protein